MSSEHQNPEYTDVFAVVAGMERMSDDLLALADEFRAASVTLRQAVRTGRLSPTALNHLHQQLVWLTGDVERMRAALRRKEEPHGS